MRIRIAIVAFVLGCGPAATDPPPTPTSPPEPTQPAATQPTPTPPSATPDPDAPPADPDSKPNEPTTTPDPAPAEPDPLTYAAADSTSVGTPTSGHLSGSIPLPLRAPGLMFLPHKSPGSRYGTVELVQGLVKAAAAVEGAAAGAPASIGDLSQHEGGALSGHASHRSGRDVDVLFYLVHEDGRPFVPAKFIPLDPEGRGTDYRDLADPDDDVPVRIDAERTWRFVSALLADTNADVQRILIVEHLRTMLLEEAARAKAPAALVRRFSEVTCQPRFPHDDHMHIRVFCSADDIGEGCRDTAPVFPWRTKELAKQGVKVVRAGKAPAAKTTQSPAKPKPKPKLKTIEQARAEAGPMHADVEQFLDRRKAWASKPHPGRRWCR